MYSALVRYSAVQFSAVQCNTVGQEGWHIGHPDDKSGGRWGGYLTLYSNVLHCDVMYCTALVLCTLSYLTELHGF